MDWNEIMTTTITMIWVQEEPGLGIQDLDTLAPHRRNQGYVEWFAEDDSELSALFPNTLTNTIPGRR
jgi:hypothetical protein